MSRRLSRCFGVVAAAAMACAVTLTGVAAPAVAVDTSTLSCSTMTLAQVQARILRDVNAARVAAGVKPLVENPFMDAVAVRWSQSQAAAMTMSHNPNYSTQIPEGWSAAAENVAYGQSATGVTTSWLNSSGHRANIVRTGFTHTGIGVGCSAKGSPYYTQVFGSYDREPGVASAPVSVKVAAGVASATVSWSSLPYSGAQTLTAFTVTSNPGGVTAATSGTARSTVVSGLIPGVAYTFTVTSTNRYGPSPASARSAAVTPIAAAKPTPKPTDATASGRLAGADRYATSATISSSVFAPGVPVVYLTSGVNFPDALSGGASAGQLRGPVLLVSPGKLPAPVQDELRRLRPQRILVLGGPAVVSDAVVTAARAYTSGKVTRISGDDRYATSAAISKATFAPGIETVYLSNGTTFPDALSGGAAAAREQAPVLLVTAGGIPTPIRSELTRLAPKRIVLLGGTGILSSAVAAQAATFTTGAVTRLAGLDRYSTSAAISAASFDPGVAVVYIASGANFPDALSGSAAVAMLGGPVLLTQPDSLPSVVRAELERLKPQRVVALGGEAVINESILRAATSYATG